MEEINVTGIIIQEERIEINYKVKGKIKKYFRENTYWMEFQENMIEIPYGISIIPFLGDILPLIWVTDTKLVIDEIDKTFYESIEDIKKGYIDMYPEMDFLGELQVNKIIDYSYNPVKESCQFFSGGVDSVMTLINRKSENQDLITIWGADVDIKNEKEWKVVENFVKEYGKDYGLKNIIIKSNFRKIYSTHKLNKVYGEKMQGNWWYNMQHGLALITLGIIHAYKNKIRVIHIPSSEDINEKNARCASYPTIDEAVKFSVQGKVIHNDFIYNRQDKVSVIINYAKKRNKKLKLRVCWEGDEGNNCNHCEKCLRTILNLMLEGQNPKDYGFNVEKNEIKNIVKTSTSKFKESSWDRMKKLYDNNIDIFKDDESINWIKNLEELRVGRDKPKKSLLKKIGGIFWTR